MHLPNRRKHKTDPPRELRLAPTRALHAERRLLQQALARTQLAHISSSSAAHDLHARHECRARDGFQSRQLNVRLTHRGASTEPVALHAGRSAPRNPSYCPRSYNEGPHRTINRAMNSDIVFD